MIFESATPLVRACDALVRARRERDIEAFESATAQLWEAAQTAPADELTTALTACAELLGELGPGFGGEFAVLCGALIELGASPEPLIPVLRNQLTEVAGLAAEFAAVWAREFPGEGTPEPDPAEFEPTLERLDAAIPPDQAVRLAESWFGLQSWMRCATTLLQNSAAARRSCQDEPALRAAVAALEPEREDMAWLAMLLSVLDGERLLVLHRPTGRGWRVTIGGIGDNFQLHSLLAATLSGPAADGLLEGLAVDPAWTAVASDAPASAFGGQVTGSFNLVDAYGAWIWNEGVPADIPALDGVRVVVLDPPPYARHWDNIRRYPMMTAAITLDYVLATDEAAAWLGRVAPAKGVGD
ncbi:hypothetical protein [Catellatospora sichuanensis]|uniref:hypothetical protein n=1 Tax=Catellatospora sichuanensis TaxID=1969805 RepID=UPI0011831100|nr:hypothetical protein [Catellatospora sichuanensis]